jgi:GTPase Era involved in 16S rRNA processing
MEVGHSLQSQTQIVHALRIVFRDNFNVVLVDTPGFDDTNRTDMDILKTIARWFGSVCVHSMYMWTFD